MFQRVEGGAFGDEGVEIVVRATLDRLGRDDDERSIFRVAFAAGTDPAGEVGDQTVAVDGAHPAGEEHAVELRVVAQERVGAPSGVHPVDDHADDRRVPACDERAGLLRRLARHRLPLPRPVRRRCGEQVLDRELFGADAPRQDRRHVGVTVAVAQAERTYTSVRLDCPGRRRQLNDLPAIRKPGFGRRTVARADRGEGFGERLRQMHFVQEEQRIVGQQARVHRPHAAADAITAEQQP